MSQKPRISVGITHGPTCLFVLSSERHNEITFEMTLGWGWGLWYLFKAWVAAASLLTYLPCSGSMLPPGPAQTDSRKLTLNSLEILPCPLP